MQLVVSEHLPGEITLIAGKSIASMKEPVQQTAALVAQDSELPLRSAQPAAQDRSPSFIARHGLLILLTLTYAISYMDRQILPVLQDPIKKELNLSDAQLGLLTGFSFALFYSLFGIPIGRLADRWIRRNVVVISMFGWSVLTAASGAATSFSHLLLARIGVAIGEAGAVPAGASLIADRYPDDRRATALAVFTGIGGPLGVLLGFMCGGLLGPAFGWRLAFVLASIPGIALALILMLAVKEEPRPTTTHAMVSFREGLGVLAGYRTLRRMALALILAMIASHAAMNWMASYMIRQHQMPIAETGVRLGLLFGAGAAIGNFTIGFLADRIAKQSIRWYLWLPAIISAVSVPFLCMALMADTGSHAISWLIFPAMFGVAYGGVTMSILHRLSPARFRGTATSLYICLISLFGIGFGTWLIGIVSDLYAPYVGKASIAYSLFSIVPAAALLSAIQFVRAAKALPSDAEKARLLAEKG
jgi:predicted MFS family arabinose efflux permease